MTAYHDESENELAAGKTMTSDTQRSDDNGPLWWAIYDALDLSSDLRLECTHAVYDAVCRTPPKVGSGELDAAGLRAATAAFTENDIHSSAPLNAMRAAIRAYLALAAPVDHPEVVGEKIKPLDESKTQGFRDDKGRFCLPLSDGYYIKFPPEDNRSGLYAVWFYTNPLGGHSEMSGAMKLAQAHHETRIRSALQPSDSPALEAGVAEAQLRAAWEHGRTSWCPAGILVDKERTEREWQKAAAALSIPATEALPKDTARFKTLSPVDDETAIPATESGK